MNRKIEVIENKEVGRKKMSLSYAERDNVIQAKKCEM